METVVAEITKKGWPNLQRQKNQNSALKLSLVPKVPKPDLEFYRECAVSDKDIVVRRAALLMCESVAFLEASQAFSSGVRNRK